MAETSSDSIRVERNNIQLQVFVPTNDTDTIPQIDLFLQRVYLATLTLLDLLTSYSELSQALAVDLTEHNTETVQFSLLQKKKIYKNPEC